MNQKQLACIQIGQAHVSGLPLLLVEGIIVSEIGLQDWNDQSESTLNRIIGRLNQARLEMAEPESRVRYLDELLSRITEPGTGELRENIEAWRNQRL